jgi:hypothetical protein
MPAVQKDYIKNYVKKFEDVLVSPTYNNPDSGYSTYIDMNSFIDNFILNEFSKNVDGYRCSSYFYKEKDTHGGKLYCGPVWDYNIAWDNAYYNGGNQTYGWQYQVYATQYFVPFWWWQFMSDDAFKNQLKCRYQQLRTTTLSVAALYAYVDSMALYLDESQNRNFTRWPIMGTYVWPNPSPIPPDYPSEIGALKYWIQARLNWMDANMPGACTAGLAEATATELIHPYPNPFFQNLHFSYDVSKTTETSIGLFDIAGHEVRKIFDGTRQKGYYEETVSTNDLSNGMYFLRVVMDGKSFCAKVVKD